VGLFSVIGITNQYLDLNLCVFNEALFFAKYDEQIYKCYSFRIGAATTAHMMGIPDNRIKAMGRWHSDSFMRYIRIPLLSGLNIYVTFGVYWNCCARLTEADLPTIPRI
jgi:hypothetical protein